MYDLAKFGQIRDFSWVGVQHRGEFEALKACLTSNSRHIETLKLHITSWSKAEETWHTFHMNPSDDFSRCNNFFAQDILCLSEQRGDASQYISFSVLRDLHLGQICFRQLPRELASSFNTFTLRRLSLWNCPEIVDLLECLAASQQSLNLKSFEMTCGHEYDHDLAWSTAFAAAIPAFLRRLEHLEDLCLSLALNDWKGIFELIFPNLDLENLKRVVFRAREMTEAWEDMGVLTIDDVRLDLEMWLVELATNGICEVIGVGVSNEPKRVVNASFGESKFQNVQLMRFRSEKNWSYTPIAQLVRCFT